jgi:peptide/nickel transport system permease protein
MRYLASRGLQALLVIVVIGVLTFFLLRITAGNPAAIAAALQTGTFNSKSAIEQYQREFGTDRSSVAQFVSFVQGLFLHGSLGTSFSQGQPVVKLLAVALPNTLMLAGTSLGLSIVTVISLGLAATRRPKGAADRVATALIVFGQSAPVFWVGLGLVLLFAVQLKWLPPGGLNGWTSLILPSVALALSVVPTQLRIFTSTMRVELDQDYMRTSRAFGIRPLNASVYAARNAMLPLLTVIGLDMAWLLGGAVVAEAVFNFPGVGSLALAAFDARDYPLIQGITIVAASLFVFLNLIIDLAYGLIDPRVRLTR